MSWRPFWSVLPRKRRSGRKLSVAKNSCGESKCGVVPTRCWNVQGGHSARVSTHGHISK